jgi:hypothetical protein
VSKDAGSVVASPAPEPTPSISHDAENAVVKVFSTMRYPDLFKPWAKQAPAQVTGSGVVIEDNGVRAQGSPDMLKVWQAKNGH